jgi:hypothetical protein
MLSWAYFSPGASLSAPRAIIHATQLPRASSPGTCPRPKPLTRPERRPSKRADAEACRSLSRAAAPPEVSHLFTLVDSSKATTARAHGFTSGPEPRRRAPSNPIWAIAPKQPKLQRQDVHPCFLPESVNQPRVGVAKHQQATNPSPWWVTGGACGPRFSLPEVPNSDGCPAPVTRCRASPREVTISFDALPNAASIASWVPRPLHVLSGPSFTV